MKSRSFLNRLKPISFGSAMADLALLLLVFFMASTTTEPPKGVEVDLPKSITQGAEQDSVYITVSAQGDYYLDGKKMELTGINDHLAMRSSEKDSVVAVTADKDLEYSVVERLLAVLKEQDFLNLVFMSQPRKKEQYE